MEIRIVEQNDTSMLIALSGNISEDTEVQLKKLLGDIPQEKQVKFNLAKITTINSLGIRAWVQFLRQLNEGREVIFQECAPGIITQINMIPSFQGKAHIESFVTNYVCESCNSSQSILLKTEELQANEIPIPAKCAKCGAEMGTEELEEEYFAFLFREGN